MRQQLTLVRFLALVGCSVAIGNPNLKYFSLYGAEAGLEPTKAATFMNFLSTASAKQIAPYHKAGLGGSLLPVQATFFCGRLLCHNYTAKWASLLKSTVAPGLQDGSLMGVHFGDELCWACTPWQNLSAAVDLVRGDLPRGKAILTYNEAYPVFTLNDGEKNGDGGLWQWNCDTGGGAHNRTPAPGMAKVAYPHVPSGLDWLSLDYYPAEGTVEGTIKLFHDLIYPLMVRGLCHLRPCCHCMSSGACDHWFDRSQSQEQKVMFVPPGYDSDTFESRNSLCCDNSTRDGANPPCKGNCTSAMLHWAKGVYDWARADTRVAALNVWHYDR
jgi:hypothetical protein